MKCPNCGLIDHNCRVIDSRPFKGTIKRTRLCSHCGRRWKSYEVTEERFYWEHISNKQIYQKWSDGEVKTLIRLREEGQSQDQIAKLLGREKSSIAMKVFKLNESGEYFAVLDELENNRGIS